MSSSQRSRSSLEPRSQPSVVSAWSGQESAAVAYGSRRESSIVSSKAHRQPSARPRTPRGAQPCAGRGTCGGRGRRSRGRSRSPLVCPVRISGGSETAPPGHGDVTAPFAGVRRTRTVPVRRSSLDPCQGQGYGIQRRSSLSARFCWRAARRRIPVGPPHRRRRRLRPPHRRQHLHGRPRHPAVPRRRPRPRALPRRHHRPPPSSRQRPAPRASRRRRFAPASRRPRRSTSQPGRASSRLAASPGSRRPRS